MNYFCLKLRLFFAPTILCFALDSLCMLRTIRAGRIYLVTEEDGDTTWILYLFHCSGQWLSLAFHWIALEDPGFGPRKCSVQAAWISGSHPARWTWCTGLCLDGGQVRSWYVFNSAAIASLPRLRLRTLQLREQKSLGTAHRAFNGHLKPFGGQNRARVRKTICFRRSCLCYRYVMTYEQGKLWWV